MILYQSLYLLDGVDTLFDNKLRSSIRRELDAPEHGFQLSISGLGCGHRLSHLRSRKFWIAVISSRCFPSGVVDP